ncbi:hypothetical protein [Accumulibacter sp.]|uniref:hypothetical protein n=1 Tax=Accumulibacter sp. TaxID=2053492 RepID=UPI0025D4DE89|nr:hypothetical protein [Accumulibacter sp.]MCP5230003.1 hypothetical protein [Accumulibacter sp.]
MSFRRSASWDGGDSFRFATVLSALDNDTITDVNGVGAAVQFACRSEQGAGVCQHGVSGDLTGQHRAARCQPTVANRWLRPVDKARRRDTGGRVRNSRDSGSPGFPLASASISRDSMG